MVSSTRLLSWRSLLGGLFASLFFAACGSSAPASSKFGQPAASSELTISQLGFTVEPVSGTAGQTLASISVAVQDSTGATVPTATSPVTLSLGGATLSGTTTVAAVKGIAKFTTLSIAAVGTYTLTASSGSITPATSTSFTIAAGAAKKLAFLQQPTDAVPGQAIAPPVAVEIVDADGNVVTSSSATVTLSFGANPSGATLSNGSATAVNGVATFPTLSLNDAGQNYTLVAKSTGLTSVTSAAFSEPPAGYPWRLGISTQPTNGTAGVTLSTVGVSIEDSLGNLVSSSTALVTLTLSSGTLAGTIPVAAVGGIASFQDLSIAQSGTYKLTASSGSLLAATTVSFIIAPGAATQLVFTGQPTNVVSGAHFSPAVQVSVRDAFGNVVTNSSAPIAMAAAALRGKREAAAHSIPSPRWAAALAPTIAPAQAAAARVEEAAPADARWPAGQHCRATAAEARVMAIRAAPTTSVPPAPDIPPAAAVAPERLERGGRSSSREQAGLASPTRLAALSLTMQVVAAVEPGLQVQPRALAEPAAARGAARRRGRPRAGLPTPAAAEVAARTAEEAAAPALSS